MRRDETGDVVLYRFDGLAGAGVTHGAVTRLGGVSQGDYATLNLGHTVGDDLDAVTENHHRLFDALGLQRKQTVSPYQIHSANVTLVGQGHQGTVQPETDGLITLTPGVAILFRFADCVPILIFDAQRRALALVHAGWRGAARGVVASAVEAFDQHAGSEPGDLWAGIGPAIGPCCYEVGPEVVEAVQAASANGSKLAERRDGTLYLDLPGAVEAQLEASGVSRVEQSQLCTSCRTDEWFSHRAERGRTGRFGMLAMLE